MADISRIMGIARNRLYQYIWSMGFRKLGKSLLYGYHVNNHCHLNKEGERVKRIQPLKNTPVEKDGTWKEIK